MSIETYSVVCEVFQSAPHGPWGDTDVREIWWLVADDETRCCIRGHLDKGEAIAHQLLLSKGEDLPHYPVPPTTELSHVN